MLDLRPNALSWFPKLLATSTACHVCSQWQQHPVCRSCLNQFAPSVCRCQRCGLRLKGNTQHAICGQCEDYPPEMDQVIVAMDFVAPWSDLISQLKFRDSPALASTLANQLAQSVSRQTQLTPDLIVPIPLSKHRWQERGYNQAWLLAQRVADQMAWRNRLSHDTLERQRETGRLMSMQADERVQRIKQAFVIRPEKRHQVEGQHVVIVDDVMTTGATANEATRTLLKAGAASVTAWFVARTPAPTKPQTRLTDSSLSEHKQRVVLPSTSIDRKAD